MLQKRLTKLNNELEIIIRQEAFGRFLPFWIAFYTSGKRIQKFKRIVVTQGIQFVVPATAHFLQWEVV